MEVGRRFGELEVLGEGGWYLRTDGRRRRLWRCRCDCGEEIEARKDLLLSGKKKACGVAGHRAVGRPRPGMLRAFGLSRKAAEYRVWCGMWERCRATEGKGWRNYASRGIRVCARWEDFRAFLADMGPRPGQGWTIERIDNEGDYEPGNCRWATRWEQNRNKRTNLYVDWEGKRQLLKDVCAVEGRPYDLVKERWKTLGWPLQRALFAPVRRYGRNRPKKVGGYVPPRQLELELSL